MYVACEQHFNKAKIRAIHPITRHIWKKFLQKGQIYYPDEHADFGEFDDVSGLAKIVNIIHGFNEHGCIKIISVESM